MKEQVTKTSWSIPAASARPEIELLLCCARTCMDAAGSERIRALLRSEIDWAYLIRLAGPHGMLPLLYWSLNKTCPEAVPEPIMDQLRDHFYHNAGHNLFLTDELLNLIRLFERDGISAIPYKGPVLTATLYENLGLREFGDLDLLVHKRDVLKAKDLLISQGYRSLLCMSSEQEAAYLRSGRHKDYQLERDDGKLILELHWKLAESPYPFPFDHERLWERLETVSLAGAKVRNFSPEDLLLILCLHGSRHLWRRLSWICDIAELIRMHQAINWGRVMKRAESAGSRRLLLLGLNLADSLLGAPLPDHVRRRVKADRVIRRLGARVSESLFRAPCGQPENLEIAFFHLMVKERLRDKVRFGYHFCLIYRRWLRSYLLGIVTPCESDRALLPLPAQLSFLYFLLRPLRLAKKHGLQRLNRHLRRIAAIMKSGGSRVAQASDQ